MDEELEKYLLAQCREWMLPEEIRALNRIGLTVHGEKVTRAAALTEFIMEANFGFMDEKTNRLVDLGEQGLNRAIAERLLIDSGNKIINTCPKCGHLARTPKAKQCRFCGHDWHFNKGNIT